MVTKLIDGKKLALEVRGAAAEAVRREGLSPGLGAVLVGDDPGSTLYVALKEKACTEAGVRFALQHLPATASQREVEDAINDFAGRKDINGILLQLPLPEKIDTEAAIAAVPPAKDADGFTDEAAVPSPLIQSILTLVRASGLEHEGKTAAVYANSQTFAERVMRRLSSLGFAGTSSNADLAIVAVGKPNWLGRAQVKEGGVVIDVGTNRVGEKVAGDADATTLDGYLSARTPVPGGVGPLTVAFLVRNVVELARHQK